MKKSENDMIFENYTKTLTEQPQPNIGRHLEPGEQVIQRPAGGRYGGNVVVRTDVLPELETRKQWREAVYENIVQNMPKGQWFRMYDWLRQGMGPGDEHAFHWVHPAANQGPRQDLKDLNQAYRRIWKTRWNFWAFYDRAQRVFNSLVKDGSLLKKKTGRALYYQWQ